MLKCLNGIDKTYIGWTINLEKRLLAHNTGKGAKYTRGKEWKLIYSEIYKSKKKAMRREYMLKKNRKLRKEIKERFK